MANNLFGTLREIIVYIFLVTGTFFLFAAAGGLLRFPDFHTRLHAGSKFLLAGATSILLGCLVREGINFVALKLAVILLFLLVTNPVAVHYLARYARESSGAKAREIVKKERE